MTVKQGDPVWLRTDMGDGTWLLNAASVQAVEDDRAEIEMTCPEVYFVDNAGWSRLGAELVEVIPAKQPRFNLGELVTVLPGDPRFPSVRLRVQAESLSARDPAGEHLQVLTN